MLRMGLRLPANAFKRFMHAGYGTRCHEGVTAYSSKTTPSYAPLMLGHVIILFPSSFCDFVLVCHPPQATP